MAKNPNLMVAIGVGKKPGPPDSGPPGFGGAPKSTPPDPMGAAPDDNDGDEGGIGPDDVDYSANDLCGSCANMGGDGTCTKYKFPVEETGHCENGYMPKDAGGDMGDMGGGSPSPDMGAGGQ